MFGWVARASQLNNILSMSLYGRLRLMYSAAFPSSRTLCRVSRLTAPCADLGARGATGASPCSAKENSSTRICINVYVYAYTYILPVLYTDEAA